MRMRDIVDLIEATAKPASFRDFYGADRATVAKAKPTLCANGWEITIPGNFATHWGEAALDEKCDYTWEWCQRAISAIRAEMGMPPKAFPRPAERSKEGYIAISPKTLLHGTSREAAASIAQQGLIPQVGKFVKGSYGDGDHAALIFAGSTSPSEIHRVVAAMYVAGGDIETNTQFFEHCALVVLNNDGKWYKQKSGYDSPKTVESGDYYRFEPIAAKKILVGDELADFFTNRLGQLPSDFIDMIEDR